MEKLRYQVKTVKRSIVNYPGLSQYFDYQNIHNILRKGVGNKYNKAYAPQNEKSVRL